MNRRLLASLGVTALAIGLVIILLAPLSAAGQAQKQQEQGRCEPDIKVDIEDDLVQSHGPIYARCCYDEDTLRALIGTHSDQQIFSTVDECARLPMIGMRR